MATSEVTVSNAQAPAQLPNHKVKIKKAGQRACNEKNEKGKFCGGHLKRWSYWSDVTEQACGDVEKAWLDSKSYVKTLRIPYHDVLSHAEAPAKKISDFLEMQLNVEAMTQQVDGTLYRNRSSS